MSKTVHFKQAKDQTAGWIALLGVCCFAGGLPVIATWVECTLNPGRLQAAISWATSLLGPYGTQATVDLCCFLTVSALWLASLACGIYYCVLYSRRLSVPTSISEE
ncbi:MAG: hypothetical protein C0478_18530 [Planctomyces sp.]|nr:hypothetical protein [Planctomyces sp.]